MRHRKHNVRFGRQKSHYKATMRHLVTGLIINKSIKTTKVKAKESSRLAERLVTMGKSNTVSDRRRAYSILGSRDLVSILFKDIAPLFKERNGGYTRVILADKRRGDNAQMAILEFVEKPKSKEEPKKKEKKKKEPLPTESKSTADKKEQVVKKKEEKKETVKLPKKPLKEPEKPEQPKEKPGIFKRFFGNKKDK